MRKRENAQAGKGGPPITLIQNGEAIGSTASPGKQTLDEQNAHIFTMSQELQILLKHVMGHNSDPI